MCTYTSTQTRTKISEVLDTATQREPIEIPRQDGSSAVVISKAEFDMIMQPHGHTIEALTNR
ncbi:hypothetical protein SB6411_00982 [Klebsiella spallanzanii]|uniref:Antitoxin n=1 Tax=Klebsiella spallanzanii TaxID=2587528 RepID=A0ABY6VAP6_9ENTR|nr:type II toxin-antitoxin system prevent-host-death family antitoxin [Klebsiella spallanzanii]VUS46291.1 hypothetical protein SB6411_00982 [Klebsiella spallanzanii]